MQIANFVICGVLLLVGTAGSDAPMGVLQRISIVVGFAWLAAFFTRLRRVNTA